MKKTHLLIYLTLSISLSSAMDITELNFSQDSYRGRMEIVFALERDNSFYLLTLQKETSRKSHLTLIQTDKEGNVTSNWDFQLDFHDEYEIVSPFITDLDGDNNLEIIFGVNRFQLRGKKKIPWLYLFEASDGIFPARPTFTWNFNLSGISYLHPVSITSLNFDQNTGMELCVATGVPERAIFTATLTEQEKTTALQLLEKLDSSNFFSGLYPVRLIPVISRQGDFLVIIGGKSRLTVGVARSGELQHYQFPSIKRNQLPADKILAGNLLDKKQIDLLFLKQQSLQLIPVTEAATGNSPLTINQISRVTDFTIYHRITFDTDHVLTLSSDGEVTTLIKNPLSKNQEDLFLVEGINADLSGEKEINRCLTVLNPDHSLSSRVILYSSENPASGVLLVDFAEGEENLDLIMTSAEGTSDVSTGLTVEEELQQTLEETSTIRGDLYSVEETSSKVGIEGQQLKQIHPDKVIKPGENLRIRIPIEELNLDRAREVHLDKELPPGMTFNPISGFLAWTPADSQLGFYYPVLKYQIDSALVTFRYTIYVNDPPKIISQPPDSPYVAVGEEFHYQLKVEDRNIDHQFTYKLNRAPEGATLDKFGLLHWLPGENDADWFRFSIQVSDGFHSDYQDFYLFVNHPVRISSTGPDFCKMGNTWEYKPTLEDKNKGTYLQFGEKVLRINNINNTLLYEIIFDDTGKLEDIKKYVQSFLKSPDSYYTVQGKKVSKNQVLADLFFYQAKLYLLLNKIDGYTPEPTEWLKAIFTSQRVSVPAYKSRKLYFYQFSAIELPRGCRMYPDGRFIWKPEPDQYDINSLVYTVSDGFTEDSESIQIYVNTPPLIISRPDSFATVGVYWTYQVKVKDNNEDSRITYRLKEHPEGMSIDRNGLISWIPDANQINYQKFVIEVDDGYERRTQTARVFVNVPPRITSEPQPIAVAGFQYNYKISTTDNNNDPVSIKALQIPENAHFNPSTGEFIWTPTEDDIGNVQLLFQATDNHGGETTQTITLQVYENPAPRQKGIFSSFFLIGFIGAISVALGIAIGLYVI